LISIIGRSIPQDTNAQRPLLKFQNPLALLLNPDICVLLLLNSIIFAIFYGVTTSISILFKTVYPFLSETDIGLCFLGMGGGMTISALTSGRLLDRQYRIIKDKMIRDLETVGVEKGDSLKPEDVTRDENFPIEYARLRLIPISLVVVCACTIGYGWSLERRVSLAIPLILHILSE
jgi:hypothetical protein